MEHRQTGLGQGEALEGGLPEQFARPFPIPVRLQSVVAARFKLRGGVPLAGRFPDPAQRGPFVGREAFPGDVAQPQVQLGRGVSVACPPVQVGQGGIASSRSAQPARLRPNSRRVVTVTVARKGMSGCGILESLQ
jgi:hypothetical protein